MAGIDDVLERLLTDTDFAHHLAQDPARALSGYELSADDIGLLSTQVSFDPGALSLVEERISKSSMFGLLTSITGGLGGGAGQLPEPQMLPAGVDNPDFMPAGVDNPDYMPPGDGSSQGGVGGAGDELAFKEVDPHPQDLGGGGGGAGDELALKEVDPHPQDLGGGGGGDEVAFKEVDPVDPDPPGDSQGIIIGGAPVDVAHGSGGGGGAGSEVFIKEVDPVDPDPPGDSQGFVFEGGVDNPDYQPTAAGDGSVRDPASLVGFNPQPDPPGVTMPGDGIIVQGG